MTPISAQSFAGTSPGVLAAILFSGIKRSYREWRKGFFVGAPVHVARRIPPCGSVSHVIEFRPKGVGPLSRELVIGSNLPGSPAIQETNVVTLTGNGIAGPNRNSLSATVTEQQLAAEAGRKAA
jgi:hypothetical protein